MFDCILLKDQTCAEKQRMEFLLRKRLQFFVRVQNRQSRRIRLCSDSLWLLDVVGAIRSTGPFGLNSATPHSRTSESLSKEGVCGREDFSSLEEF